ELENAVDAGRPTLDGILGLKGVLEQHEVPLDSEAQAELETAVFGAVDRALADLQVARRREGVHIGDVLRGQVDEIERLRQLAEGHPGRSRDAVLARLKEAI